MAVTDTKSQIFLAALDLFALNGFEKTTMRSIARKVGIQSASIYYYYDSKESLLRAIYSEFENNFAKYRNEPETIFKAAKEKPLSDVLKMIFYTFGNSAERDKMMMISRVILSLQYENFSAQELYEKVMIRDALNYGMKVFNGLYSLGKIKKVNFEWITYIFHAFAISFFQENIRSFKSYSISIKEYEEGSRFLCSSFAQIIGI